MALSDDEFRLALGDHVFSLCDLLEITDPTRTIRLEISVKGLEIEHAGIDEDGIYRAHTIRRPGPVQYRTRGNLRVVPTVADPADAETVADLTEAAPTEYSDNHVPPRCTHPDHPVREMVQRAPHGGRGWEIEVVQTCCAPSKCGHPDHPVIDMVKMPARGDQGWELGAVQTCCDPDE